MASGNTDLSLVPWGHEVSHMTAGYLQCLSSLALSNHSTLHWSLVGPRLDFSYADRCKGVFFPSFSPNVLQPWITQKNTRALGDVRVCWFAFVTVCVCAFAVRHTKGDTDCLQDQWISGQFILWMSLCRAFIPRQFHCITNKTVLLDPHLTEGKAGLFRSCNQRVFFFCCCLIC